MEKTLFATRALAEQSLKDNYANCSARKSTANIDDFDDDRSLIYLGQRGGECSCYNVEDTDGNLLAVLAWWEDGGEYRIRKNGTTVQTVTYWSLARHVMKELAEQEEEKELNEENYIAADIDCVIDGNEIVNAKEI